MSIKLPGNECVGRILEGRFRLLRGLGGTAQSSVFLTELPGDPPRKATIKFVAADERRRAQWEAARSQSHPALIRLLEFGQCELDGKMLDYILTEYAEEVLAEILAERPLTPPEAAVILPPIADALSYLHAGGLVHGGLKPENILAVGDHLKLSVDGLEVEGEPSRGFHLPSEYDAPEIGKGRMAPEMDVWSLGAVLVKALTLKAPSWNRSKGADPVVPESIPEPFASIAQDCLRVDPARRFKLANIRARLEASPVPETRSAAAPKPASVPVDGNEGEKHSRLPRTIAVLAMLIAAILIVAVEIRWHSEEAPGAAVTEDSSSAPATSAAHAAGADGRATGGSVVKGAVAERVLPEVPQRAMETIDGHVRVEIRVQVDRDGNVSDAGIVSQGPSRYFANYALNAARGWKFKPAQRGGHAANSTWMLHFVFQRSGVEVTPVETRP